MQSDVSSCCCTWIGLANKKSVSILPAGEGLNVTLGTAKTKKGHLLGQSVNRSLLKRDFRKMAKAVVNQVVAVF